MRALGKKPPELGMPPEYHLREEHFRLALLEAAELNEEFDAMSPTVKAFDKFREKYGIPDGISFGKWYNEQLRLSAGCDFP